MDRKKLTYRDAGVTYDTMDEFKRTAQIAGLNTSSDLGHFGLSNVQGSCGESVSLIESSSFYLGHVNEGLGTKNLVADEVYHLTGRLYFSHIAQDTVAMIVNDMVTCGVIPVSVAMHLAVGESSWFDDIKRWNDLITGWVRACNLARCNYGGGETAVLKDIIIPGAFAISGSAIGVIQPKDQKISGEIQHGDAIILLASSGIHANGLTLARKVASRKDSLWKQVAHLFWPGRFQPQALPRGYLTPIGDGRTYGEELLDPTMIYVPLIEDCLKRGVKINYAVNITGHGWRKLMRPPQPFSYIIENLPAVPPIFEFIQKHGPVDDYEAYATFNMGAGFALYTPETEIAKIKSVIESYDNTEQRFIALNAGHIEKSNEKKVVIRPKGIEYSGETLNIRGGS